MQSIRDVQHRAIGRYDRFGLMAQIVNRAQLLLGVLADLVKETRNIHQLIR